MADIKYKIAPVSEVIFGVTFKSALLGKNNFYLKFLSTLIDEYPGYSVHVPLFNEELKGYQNNLVTNPSVTGPVLHRLRSEDQSWLIQIQLNKLYLNWIRDDQKDPGNYPGYTQIFKTFKDLLNRVFEELEASDKDIDSYELSYHDRIRWTDYVDNIKDVNEIVNYTLPQLNFGSQGIEIVNFNKRLNARVSNIGGFMTFNFATLTEITGKQILGLELSLKGIVANISSDEWFEEAHQMQIKLFAKFLNPQILEKWK